MSRKRYVLFAATALILGVTLAIAAIEVTLRWQGNRPWRFVGDDVRIPIMFEADPTLGWRPKPGSYLTPAYDWSGPRQITIRADRSRDTGAPADQPPGLVFVGCSFTFGWGVSDNETFAARLQQQHPDWHVMNLGVPAYGPYQSLLRLEQLLSSGIKPTRVLYGYMQGHELRNIAHPVWTQMIEKYSTQGMVAVPYPTLNDGHLVRHPPERYPGWPLREYLALIPYLEVRWAMFARRDRIAQRMEIMDRTVLDIAQLCKEHGVEFGMVLLQAQAEWKDHYARLLGSHNIPLIDCALQPTAELIVPHDGHPNANAHKLYAYCIDQALTAPPR